MSIGVGVAGSLGDSPLPVVAAWPSPDLSPLGFFCGLWIILELQWCGQHSDTEPVLSVLLSSGKSGGPGC